VYAFGHLLAREVRKNKKFLRKRDYHYG